MDQTAQTAWAKTLASSHTGYVALEKSMNW
jgi:hypothetical protein